MRYELDAFTLDTDTRELRRGATAVALEPQVFDLLVLLLENRHRVVSKDEIVQRVWFGRVVSDWTILGRIKSLRQALGDDGSAQKYVRTLRGQGFRFVAPAKLVSVESATALEASETAEQKTVGAPPCIAVLPFSAIGDLEIGRSLADAVPRELIRSLSSVRWLRVIAHGSSFRFRGQTIEFKDVKSLLGAQYCISGMVEALAGRLYVDVEMADTRTSEVVWAIRKEAPIDEVQRLRTEIAGAVLNISEFELPEHEARLLEVDDAENLDAWSSLHLGIRHMYRFNKSDTEIARKMFERAVTLEPTLARAHAGISFTTFQRVFLGYSSDLAADRLAARRSAEESVLLQPRDPFSNVVMGRSLWLTGDTEASKPWFDRAVLESPNYAFGRYASSWAKVFTSDYAGGNEMTDLAIALSPLDPLRGGMLCNKMWIALAAKDYDAAVQWAQQTALTPGAHAGHAMFAAMTNRLIGNDDGVSRWLKETKRRNPGFSKAKAKALVPSSHTEFRALTEEAAIALGLPD
ncbi:transcriptional regulator [Ruegeria atlantica]|uniref:Transcriptional regulator n=1 Tax=Ruegeria atlantica TaxID=81569 RepID=A0AA90Z0G1_9RHOB|nr:winged helix-turn-helix domain-containing protein [Ruegeria atlantica]NOE18471.1 transcriptional regulator [Ruegeria atlantica]